MKVHIDRNDAISVLLVTILILILAAVFFRPLYIKSPSSISKSPVSTVVETPQQEPISELVIPINPLPTDKDIEESIKIQNQKKQMLETMTAERKSGVSQIKAEAEMDRQEKEPQLPEGKDSATKIPPEEARDKVKSHEYFIR